MAFASSNGGVRHLQPNRVPVILANYTDVTFNNTDYSAYISSLQQYWTDNSFGQYTPSFEVVGTVMLAHNQRYYGENDYYGDDLRADEMVQEACNLAENLADFTQYDQDGDGKVDAVVVIYAGQGEVYGVSNPDAVWAYTANLEESDEIDSYVVLDGKTVTYFSAVPELQTTTKRDGIGTLIHEFAHILGLPNFCTTDGGMQKTLGNWDVMDHGCYNNESRTPASLSAYERFYLGWVEPILLNEPMNVRLRDFNTTGDCAIITASGQSNLSGISPDPREFYILENRQQSGWDQYLPGHGLMLTKIDFVKNKWESDEVNNVERHPCVDLIEADGSAPKYKADNLNNGYFGKQGDLFPAGATSKNMFSNKMYFENVTEQNGIIRFDFNGGVNRCEVNFYAGANGTCATASLKETGKGAGVVLPNVTAKTNYTFLGWATRKSSMTPDAGKAGDRFYPMSDCTLYALYRNETRVDVLYSLKGVEWNSGATYYANRNQAFDISFKAKQGYLTPAGGTCQVRVVCGNKPMSNYAFEGDSLIVRFAAADVTDNIYITVINVREQKEDGCDAYSHIFTSTCYAGTLQDFSGYDWNVTIANAETVAYDKNKGATFGSGTYPSGLVRLYTEETFGCAVSEIRVKAAANGDGVLSVYVAGNQIGDAEYLESTLTEYTFQVEEPVSGAVEIRLENTQKAMYLKSIEMDFIKWEEPEVIPTEGVETISDKRFNGQKLLLNGQLYILHNGRYYNVLGTKMN
jgi:M6 family metalloprotease-like protein